MAEILASRRLPAGTMPVVTVCVLVLAVIAVPLAVPLDQQAVDLGAARMPPSLAHPFGTDEMGRDVLLRCVYGLRVSLMVGLASAVVSTVLGAAVGALAAVRGGWVDRLTMRLIDTVAAIPHLVLGIFLVALFRPSAGAVIASVGLTHWLTIARIVRAELLSLRERPYILAAVSGGAGRRRVLTRHLLPAVAPHALLAAVLLVPHAIWHESALSFLGLGLPPHLASLGTMIHGGALHMLTGVWWPALFPCAFIVATTLAISGLAGAWRDRLDPHRPSEADL